MTKRRFEKCPSPWDDSFTDFTEYVGKEYQTLSIGVDKGNVRIGADGSGSGGSSYSIPLSFDEVSEVIDELNRAKRKAAHYGLQKAIVKSRKGKKK